MKKLLATMVIFLFICMSFNSISGIQIQTKTTIISNRGNTLYVGGNGSGNYSKIQDAIDNASDEDTVFVYNGTYYINGSSWYGLVINKSIKLIREDKYTTILEGNDKIIVVYLEMMDFVENVEVSGFTIQNGRTGINYDTGINNNDKPYYLQNQEHYHSADFNNNIIKNNDQGIVVGWMSEGVNVGYNIITMNKKGIILYNCFMDIYVYHNTIENNEYGICVEGWGYGIYGNTISENVINSNKEKGITLSYSYGDTITQNTIFNNSKGIDISYSSDTCIDYNTIQNTIFGIYIINSNNNIIKKNIITENTDSIYILDSEENTINDNTISNNKNGIYLFNCSNNKINDNNITSNNNYGINLQNSNSNNISKNNFINNKLHAFFIKEYTIWEFIKNYQKDKNIWNENYWNEPRNLPKLIFGILNLIIFSKRIDFFRVDFDWHPAKEPYDI